MSIPDKEPVITVGLIEDVPRSALSCSGEFHLENIVLKPGAYRVFCEGELLCITIADGDRIHRASSLQITPAVPESALFTLHEVKIGKLFHWERSLVQKFKGALHLMMPSPGHIIAINSINLETYLASVIASEMSPENKVEFLKAHCICSRSWLLISTAKKILSRYQATRLITVPQKLFPGLAVKRTGILMCARMTIASATRAWAG